MHENAHGYTFSPNRIFTVKYCQFCACKKNYIEALINTSLTMKAIEHLFTLIMFIDYL